MIKCIIAVCSSLALVACGGGSDDPVNTTPPGTEVPRPNVAPVAHAGGAQNVSVGTTVTLDGSASSDANGDALTYSWTLSSKPVGSNAQLSANNEVRPSFTADAEGTYVFSLIVNDGQADSQEATVSVTASPVNVNVAPIAHAGTAQNISVGTSVVLDGSASSDADGDALTYAWTLTSKPDGSNAELFSANAVSPSFTADIQGTYVFALVVNDGSLDSEPATVTITAADANVAPVANAGVAQNITVGTTATLDGAASSDANGDALTYAWTLTSKPEGSNAELSSANAVSPNFTADREGTYVFSLIVNDGSLDSEPATVVVTAAYANVAPVAQAGAAQNIAVGATVILDGSASSDANGDVLTYAWSMTSKPEGSNAQLSSQGEVKPSFTADIDGAYVFSLVVSDGVLSSEPSTVTVTAVTRSLNLYRVGGFLSGDQLLKFPYTSSASVNASVNCVGSACATSYEIDSYKLTANGATYTIANLKAENLTSGSTVNVFFDGLANGQTITSGSPVTFKLRSGFTKGATINARYSFSIKETGETFNYSVGLKTN